MTHAAQQFAENAPRTYPPVGLADPFASMSDVALGRHFAQRSNGHFFSVPDPDETRKEKIEAILRDQFEFNGETHALTAERLWLENPSADVEWHILLHKFYYAVGLGIAFEESNDPRYVRKWVDLVSSWITTTPPGFIAADVTGRRVQNWIYAHTYFAKAIGSEHYPLAVFTQVLRALAAQVEFLCTNLTAARNHRTLELYAIFLAGIAFPEFARARQWREFALAELVNNIQSDLLADGVQCELSTDYHHLVLKNYLCVRRLAKLNDISVPAIMDHRLVQALEFSLFVHKPDGIVPSLSDGDARSFLPLLREGHELYGRDDMLYVATRGLQGTAPRQLAHGFPASGYYVVRSGWGEGDRCYQHEHYLVFDCGPLGAGNHGHLDCLSFELAAQGRSLVVDPGRYTYSEAGDVNWRIRFRGTGYHNTVTVDDRNQTRYEPREVKDASRHRTGSVRHRITGPAPEHELRTFFVEKGLAVLHGVARSHEYSAVHERQIAFAFGEYWIVSDTVSDDTEHQYDCRFHLSEIAHQNVSVKRRWGTFSVESPNLVVAHEDTADHTLSIDAGFVSYRYGIKYEAPVVKLTQRAAVGRFNTLLYPHAAAAPEIAIRELAVDNSHASPSARAIALKLQITRDGVPCNDYLLLADCAHSIWHFGEFTFCGKHLAVRQDAAGEIVEVHTDRGAWLEHCGQQILWRGAAS